MKKLIVTHGQYGHIELAETAVVPNGIFKGLGQKELFERIMTEGYGKNVPALFHATFDDGTEGIYRGKDAGDLIGRTDVNEVVVVAPICGG